MENANKIKWKKIGRYTQSATINLIEIQIQPVFKKHSRERIGSAVVEYKIDRFNPHIKFQTSVPKYFYEDATGNKEAKVYANNLIK